MSRPVSQYDEHLSIVIPTTDSDFLNAIFVHQVTKFINFMTENGPSTQKVIRLISAAVGPYDLSLTGEWKHTFYENVFLFYSAEQSTVSG